MRNRKRVNPGRGEEGQMIIFFVLAFTVILVIGTLVIDVGSFQSDRRTAQKDADSAVLSGAIPIAFNRGSATMEAEAIARTEEWALRNGVEDVALVVNPRIVQQCFAEGPAYDGVADGVETEIDADSPLLLGNVVQEIFGGDLAIDVGAHAKACVGSLVTTTGLRPWAMPQIGEYDAATGTCSTGSRPLVDPTPDSDDDCISDCFEQDDFGNIVPSFGATCRIRSDQPQSVGSINLESDEDAIDPPCDSGNSSAAEYKNNIIEGSPAACSIGDIVGTKQGLATGPTKDGTGDLLDQEDVGNDAGDGCDVRFNNPPNPLVDQGNNVGGVWIDDFWEVFTPPDAIPGPDTVYTARECDDDTADLLGEPDSPRFITIAMIRQLPLDNGTQPVEILAFAGFFIEKCEKLDNSGNVVPSNSIDEAKCNISGSGFQIVGRFVQFQRLGGVGGPLNPFGTKVILLVE